MSEKVMNVLFVCTGNSARSILAKSVLNNPTIGGGRFRAFSAGSHPSGQVQPMALELLKQYHYPTSGLRSKSWDEFSANGAPELDFVFTVCDNAAGEVCPIWTGQPMTAHWGVPDPAAAVGSPVEIARAFANAYGALQNRIAVFVNLPFAGLDRLSLQARLDTIGRTSDANDNVA